LTPQILNQAEHEIPEQYLDCSKARRRLGWMPRHSLEEALRETIAWYEPRIGAAPRAAADEGISSGAR
jgi:CDP-glucose 4,6-dehydratase